MRLRDWAATLGQHHPFLIQRPGTYPSRYQENQDARDPDFVLNIC